MTADITLSQLKDFLEDRERSLRRDGDGSPISAMIRGAQLGEILAMKEFLFPEPLPGGGEGEGTSVLRPEGQPS